MSSSSLTAGGFQKRDSAKPELDRSAIRVMDPRQSLRSGVTRGPHGSQAPGGLFSSSRRSSIASCMSCPKSRMSQPVREPRRFRRSCTVFGCAGRAAAGAAPPRAPGLVQQTFALSDLPRESVGSVSQRSPPYSRIAVGLPTSWIPSWCCASAMRGSLARLAIKSHDWHRPRSPPGASAECPGHAYAGRPVVRS
jgi:hypothetical protein